MKNIIILFILFFAFRLSAAAQVSCQETITWLTYFEQGKAQPRTKSSEYFKCTDKNGNIVKEREFGDGRVLLYVENTYNAKNKLVKTYYTHGYESNDGGEGTTTYQYLKNNKTIINTITANFSIRTETDVIKNRKGFVIRQNEKQRRKSELLEDYNSYTETSTTYQYLPTDSLLKKVSIIKDSATTRQISEMYQYEGNLKTRFEYLEEENGKKVTHTVKNYQYDAQKQLIEEKTLVLPQYLIQSMTIISYQEGKVKEIEKIDYKDFAKKEMSYHDKKKFEYDEKGILTKTFFESRYFYEGSFSSFVETKIEQQASTKKVITTTYSDKSEGKRVTIQLYEAEKLLRTEEYKDAELSYIYEYEYNIK